MQTQVPRYYGKRPSGVWGEAPAKPLILLHFKRTHYFGVAWIRWSREWLGARSSPPVATQLERRQDNMSNELILEQCTWCRELVNKMSKGGSGRSHSSPCLRPCKQINFQFQKLSWTRNYDLFKFELNWCYRLNDIVNALAFMKSWTDCVGFRWLHSECVLSQFRRAISIYKPIVIKIYLYQ